GDSWDTRTFATQLENQKSGSSNDWNVDSCLTVARAFGFPLAALMNGGECDTF
ncbi:hypothetical protein HDU76_010004, partial [Blyttiomyces sp. JEL0837]